MLAAVVGLSAFYFAIRVGWAYPDRGLAPATARWAKVQRLASWAGLGVDPQATPVETARALQRDLEAGDDIEPLARSFTRERYGGPAVEDLDDPELRQIDSLYRRIRNRLVRETLLRRFGLRRRSRSGAA